MGFYYGSSQPPDDDPKPGSWGETFAIIIAVFRTLALPLALLFGTIFGLLGLIWAFTISGWLGLAILLIIVGALVGYGFWESKHPPEIL